MSGDQCYVTSVVLHSCVNYNSPRATCSCSCGVGGGVRWAGLKKQHSLCESIAEKYIPDQLLAMVLCVVLVWVC